MGRSYFGDIEGKMWFGIQSSNDASFFGGTECEPNTIEYSFISDDLEQIKDGIEKCKEALGENKEKLDVFFSSNNVYNNKMISNEISIREGDVNKILKWYARLEMGIKIAEKVEEMGSCVFEVEL
jgi:hypothetical protein